MEQPHQAKETKEEEEAPQPPRKPPDPPRVKIEMKVRKVKVPDPAAQRKEPEYLPKIETKENF